METAACFCSSADYSCEFYDDELRQARKAHQCIECDEVILPGQQYLHSRYRFEGSWGKYDTCILCDRIRSDVYSQCNGWVAGELRDVIQECWGFDYVCDMREDLEGGPW